MGGVLNSLGAKMPDGKGDHVDLCLRNVLGLRTQFCRLSVNTHTCHHVATHSFSDQVETFEVDSCALPVRASGPTPATAVALCCTNMLACTAPGKTPYSRISSNAVAPIDMADVSRMHSAPSSPQQQQQQQQQPLFVKLKEKSGFARVTNFLKRLFADKKADEQLDVTPQAAAKGRNAVHGSFTTKVSAAPLKSENKSESQIPSGSLGARPPSPSSLPLMSTISEPCSATPKPASPPSSSKPLVQPVSPTSTPPATTTTTTTTITTAATTTTTASTASPATSAVDRPQASPPVSRLSPNETSTLLVAAPVLPKNMSRPVWCLKDYHIVQKLYTGYASTVYKAWCKASGETVCLKSYNLGSVCELNRFQILREIKLHAKLQHENVITLYGAFQQGNQVVLVQEFAETGDLFALLHRYGGKMPERTAVEMVLRPFLTVLTYMHQNCIAHRDIKPENVLFTQKMKFKLADFGLAIDLREERAVTRAGTLEYMAPEVLLCPFKSKPMENKEKTSLHYNHTVDTWAVGVLTYELLVGFPPFNDKQRSMIEEKIRDQSPRFPSSMSELARSFIMTALQKDALERPTVSELLTHPWILSLTRRESTSPRSPLSADKSSKQLLFALPEEIAQGDRNSRLKPNAKAKAHDVDSTLRTADGDLLKPVHTFMSFSAGTNRPKLNLDLLNSGDDKPQQTKSAAPAPAAAATRPSPGTSASQQQASKQVQFVEDAAPKQVASRAVRQNFKAGMSFSSAQNPTLMALRKDMAKR